MTFNFNQQELQHGYQTSMNSYQDERVAQFLLQDTLSGRLYPEADK